MALGQLLGATTPFQVARTAEVMVVHLVPEDGDELAELFGSKTGDDIDKFAMCDWTRGPDGTPVLDGCPNWFAGQVLERIPAGDHWAFLLDTFAAEGAPHADAFTSIAPSASSRATRPKRLVGSTVVSAAGVRPDRRPVRCCAC